ncbi:TRAF-like protein [Corchorus olitorius]|uniref:TRAF-like protein n=1 Tax=Corchorus olitorius TaxID=93759 RepID=A0A1R3HEF9_9ROSI|nr:TRAF-like protein [Corchorus olitorius]
MEESSSTEPPAGDVELVPEKIKDAKEGGPTFHCDLCDVELVYKIAQALLPGLATACVDNTTGDVFKSPGSVAADIRKEMVDYLIQRSETFVAESVILEGGPEAEASDHPFDIIGYLVDEFASSKRNLLGRVSGWLLSDKREDKIDDFGQEMEINGFWPIEKREAIVQTLLKNVDFKNAFHCDIKFNSADELALHVSTCSYSSMNCENEGCNARFSANQAENHDSVCPFKIIQCEQKCSDSIMRREMDRHCITVCPMKLVNCPFYAVGCKSAVPQCKIDEHRSENLDSHILYVLQGIYKEASVEDLKGRVEQILKTAAGRLAESRQVRSFTSKVKDLDAQLGPLQITTKKEADEEVTKTEAKLESLDVSDTNKDTERAAESEVKDSNAKPQSLEVTPTIKNSDEAAKAELKGSDAKLQSLEVAPTNEDSKEATKTETNDTQAKPRSLEVAPTDKDSEEATKTETNDIQARPQSLEVTPTSKNSDEAAKAESKGSDAKLQSLEVAPTNEDSKEATKTETNDTQAKPRSLEVAPTDKNSEEATKTENNDTQAKPQSLEDAAKDKDSERAPKTIVNGSETRPPSVEVTLTDKVTEEATKNSVNDIEGKLQTSEVGTISKNNDGKVTPNHVPNIVDN